MMRSIRRTLARAGVVGGLLLLWSGWSPVPVIDRQPTVAYAASLATHMGVSYSHYSDNYFAVVMPVGWIVSDGQSGITVSSPTGAARYEYAYAYGGVVGTYTLSGLTRLAISTLQLNGVRILQGPATAQLGAGWSMQTTAVRGDRAGQTIDAVVRVQLVDDANGEAIVGEAMSAPASRWRMYRPMLITIQKSLRVMVGDECRRLGVGCY